MKHALIALLLTGCASQPTMPEGFESSAAVGSVAFWRWSGKAILQLITNTNVNVDIKSEKGSQ